jgi:anti-sigma B factor antagonist
MADSVPPAEMRRLRLRSEAVTADASRIFETEGANFGGAPGVVIRGDVDLAVVPSLERTLDAAIRDSIGAFVIDLCDATFLDSCGLRVLLRARSLLARDERQLAIACPPDGAIGRLFQFAGVADLFFLYDSREAVAGAIHPRRRRHQDALR